MWKGDSGGAHGEQPWMVLLEAAGDPSCSAIDPDRLQDVMELMGCDQIVGLHHPYRHAIQSRVVAATPAEALFTATARWADALRRLGLEGWTLQRTEVLTTEEYMRDHLLAERSTPSTGDVAALGGEGDDLLRRVFYDSLTGFPTLVLFRDRAQGIVARDGLAGRLAVVMIDLDGVGAVNRELGYTCGDQVLVEVAGRLTRQAETTWAVGRLPGEQFVLLVDDSAGAAELTAADLVAALSTPIVVKGRPIRLTASVGLAAVDEVADFDELLARAGTAMEAAKAAGGDRYQRYQPEHGGPSAHMEFDAPGVPDRLAYVMLLERAALAANECSSLEEAAAIVLRQVITHTGWRAGHLWLVDRVEARLKPSGVWQVSGPDAMKEFRLHTERVTLEGRVELAALVLASGRPEWATFGGDRGAAGDAGGDAAARAAGLVAAAAFPVLAGSEVVAVLGFYATSPIAPDDSLIDVMACVGAQLGRISERTRAADQLARSEERYRTLADTLPSLIWMAGAGANCTFVNRRWLEFTGRTLEQELGHGWAEVVHPDDVGRCIQTFINAFDRREPVEIEFRKRRADGEYRWMLSRGGPVFEHGEFVGYVGTSIDVSDRHQAQAHLRDEEVRFRTLVGSSDVMIVVLAADGTLIDEFLPASGLGYQPGEGRGRLGFEFLHPDDLERATTEFAAALAHPGRSRPFECRVRHADGSWRWLRAVPNNMLADPLVKGLVVTATDITDTKALLERLRAAEERLRQADGPLPRPTIAVRSRH